MKVFFKEIRAGSLEAVRSRLAAQPQLVHATAKPPPKKDDGQSPLHVALKCGQFEMAHLLLDHGADVNVIEASELNQWNAPVLHDATMAAVFSSRWGRNWSLPGEPPKIEFMSTEHRFNEALSVLNRMLECGADVTQLDSRGNTALMRAVIEAQHVSEDPPLPDMLLDLRRVFNALLNAGADPEWRNPNTNLSPVDVLTGTGLRPLLP